MSWSWTRAHAARRATRTALPARAPDASRLGWVVASETAALDLWRDLRARGRAQRAHTRSTPRACTQRRFAVRPSAPASSGKSLPGPPRHDHRPGAAWPRREMGAALLRENPIEADYGDPPPDSGTPAAMATQKSRIPFARGLVKGTRTWATLHPAHAVPAPAGHPPQAQPPARGHRRQAPRRHRRLDRAR